jgi:peptidyl-prolyl cis-trans isomerase C
MKAGDVSDKPVKTDFGWHILKVEDRRKSSPPPLAEVRGQLSNQVGQDLVGDYVKSLQAKAKIERFAPDGTPLPPPNATASTK